MLAHALDEVLTRYDVNEVHERRAEAPPAAVWKALREVTGDDPAAAAADDPSGVA